MLQKRLREIPPYCDRKSSHGFLEHHEDVNGTIEKFKT